MAERVGFEPTLEFPLNTLSKRAPSTTRPSLRGELKRCGGQICPGQFSLTCDEMALRSILKGMRIDRLHVPLTCLMLCATASAQDWPMYLKDLTHSSFNNAETQFNIKTIATLRPAWTTSLGGYLSAGVTLSNGVLYIGNWSVYVSAAATGTGKIIWTTFVGKAPDPADPTCMQGIGVAGQPTVLGNAVYVGGGDSAVYALDKSN